MTIATATDTQITELEQRIIRLEITLTETIDALLAKVAADHPKASEGRRGDKMVRRK